MRCEIQWIDENDHRTPDENEAVAMAYFHNADDPNWDVIMPICQDHVNRINSGFKSWSVLTSGVDLNKWPDEPRPMTREDLTYAQYMEVDLCNKPSK